MNVNFFSPASATSTSNLPVMIYLYGGGFTEGSNQVRVVSLGVL